MSRIFEVKTTTGKSTRTWKIWSEGANIITEYGVVGGKLQRSTRIAVAKNVGKSNETTPEEQAILEVERDYKKYREKSAGKVLVDDVTEVSYLVSPMLAKSNYKPADLTFPLIVQPKLDGVRAIAIIRDGNLELYSRNKKLFNHFLKIKEEILKLGIKDIIFDGEIYSKDLFHEDGSIVPEEEKFQILQKAFAVGRKEPSFYDSQVQYHIFDIVDKNKTQIDRLRILDTVPESEHIKIVKSHLIEDEVEGDELFDQYIKEGYEGLIYRPADLKYVPDARRLMKRKSGDEDEFEIVGFKEGIGKMRGGVVWRVSTLEGEQFDVVPLGSMDDRREMFENGEEYVGKLLTVKFDGKFASGVPRFPIGKTIRDYE